MMSDALEKLVKTHGVNAIDKKLSALRDDNIEAYRERLSNLLASMGKSVINEWFEDSQVANDKGYLHVTFDNTNGIKYDITLSTKTGKSKLCRRKTEKPGYWYERMSEDGYASKNVNTVDGVLALVNDINNIGNSDIEWVRKNVYA